MERKNIWNIWPQLWLQRYAGNQQIIKASTVIQYQLGDKIPFSSKENPRWKEDDFNYSVFSEGLHSIPPSPLTE